MSELPQARVLADVRPFNELLEDQWHGEMEWDYVNTKAGAQSHVFLLRNVDDTEMELLHWALQGHPHCGRFRLRKEKPTSRETRCLVLELYSRTHEKRPLQILHECLTDLAHLFELQLAAASLE